MNEIGRDKLTLLAVKILEGLFYWNTTSGYHNFVKGVWVLGIQFGLFWFCHMIIAFEHFILKEHESVEILQKNYFTAFEVKV